MRERFNYEDSSMVVSESLQQIYFLGSQPDRQQEVAQALMKEEATKEDEVGRWHLFARLSRPGVIAMREVRRTIGLDRFLLKPEMAGVEDVAEIMGYGLQNGGVVDQATPFHACWSDFERRRETVAEDGSKQVLEACLFLTFLRLNWDVLMSRELWRGYGFTQGNGQPSRSQILRALSAVLDREINRPSSLSKEKPVHFHLAGGTGDCDVIITGLVASRMALDTFLLILAQLGTDSLVAELMNLSLEQVKQLEKWYPICASSMTELAVPWELYEDILDATKDIEQRGLTPAETALKDRIDRHLVGGLRSAVFLRRTRSFLADVRHEVTQISPAFWKLQAVLGEADMLLRRYSRKVVRDTLLDDGEEEELGNESLSDLLILMGRLDGRCKKADFPRRTAAVLSFDDPLRFNLNRRELLEVAAEKDPDRCPAVEGLPNLDDVDVCLAYLEDLLKHSRRREEYRILERMVERAVTLQRHGELSRELRITAQLILRRLARALKRRQPPVTDAEKPMLTGKGPSADDQAKARNQVVQSGMHLERTLSHHSRGVVPLLLSTITQARSMDHFGSETMLTSALGAPASSVARRLLGRLAGHVPEEMLTALRDMASPILYASHDPDFSLVLALGMIRVPRWVIWYPTASSYVLHEVGHAVFLKGGIQAQADCVVAGLLWHLYSGPGEQMLTSEPSPNQEVPRDVRLDTAVRKLCGIKTKELEVTPRSTGGGPAVYQWILQLLKDRAREVTTKPTGTEKPLEEWDGQLDEITAELFCHRYSYPQDGSLRHVYDVLEHVSPLAHRMSRSHRLLFISRELAVRIAQCLITASTEQPLAELDAAKIQELVVNETDIYRRSLARWLNEMPVPFDEPDMHGDLIRDVRDIWLELTRMPLASDEKAYAKSYFTPTGKAIQWGIFVACLARSEQQPVLPVFLENTGMAQHLWRAVLETSLEADVELRADADLRQQEEQILEDLMAGKVPATVSQWPERLPRRLHDALRQQNASVLMPQRFALTLALADWMIIHAENP